MEYRLIEIFEQKIKDKIAVKAITHYGDEVLKVYPID